MPAFPKVTVVTVCYNAAATIEKTIQSVVAQAYDNKEFVIIDGGSSDETVDIIRKYEGNIDFFISEKDRGIPDALNKGIRYATGEWLYFLSSDDIFYNDHVIKDIFSQPVTADMIYGSVILKSQNVKYDGEFDLQKVLTKNICHQAQFYHRELFEKVGVYDERYRFLSDYDHTLRIFAASGLKIQYVDKIIAIFNDTGRTSYIVDNAFWQDRKRIFLERFKHQLSYKSLSRSYETYLYHCLKDGSIAKGFVVLLQLLYYSRNIHYFSAAFRNLMYRIRSHAGV